MCRNVAHKTSAFSLIELALVLVVAGLVAGGITAGTSLVRTAEVKSVNSDLQHYQSAVQQFADKYKAVPGDMVNAESYWDTAGAGCPSGLGSGTQTCNGNGNKQIDTDPEMFRFWQHLADAGMIDGGYTGVAGSGGAQHHVPGQNAPRGKMDKTGYGAMYRASVLGTINGNTLTFGKQTGSDLPSNGALTPQEASDFDVKYDDGKPGFGKVQQFTASSHPTCATTDVASTAVYAVTSNDKTCPLIYKFSAGNMTAAAAPIVPINGACNNSVALGCTAGSPGSDNGLVACGTTHQWICTGSGGGSDSGTCSYANPVCPINGVCNNAVALGCTTGTMSTDGGQVACGTTHTWHCDGSSGGTNATNCQKANPACAGCVIAAKSWTVSGHTCTANLPATGHNANGTATDSTGPDTGSAAYLCTNGVWAGAPNGESTCSAPSGCAAQFLTDECETSLPVGANGDLQCSNCQCSGWFYQTTYQCSGGTWTSVDSDGHFCFLADTKVTLADGKQVAVKDLKAGDKVKGQGGINTVQSVSVRDTDGTIYGFNGGKAFVTGGHPFMTEDGWKAIDPTLTPTEKHNVKTTKLAVGDAILMEDGSTLKITSIDVSKKTGDHTVYSPIMDGDHTYYANSLLVHNKSTECPIGGGPTSSGACAAATTCAAAARSWTVSGNTCTATVPITVSPMTGTATDSTGPAIGTAEFTCTGTTLAAAPEAGATCNAAASGCAANTSYSWSSGGMWGATCDGSVPALAEGESFSPYYCVADTEGSVILTCTGGTLVESSKSCLRNCFLDEVLISMEDGSSKPVSELKEGDRVKGETGINTVQAVRRMDKTEPIYGFNGGEAFVTSGHPFMTKGGWKAIDPIKTKADGHDVQATKLEVGDAIRQQDGGWLTIISIDAHDLGTKQVNSPSVSGDHTFYANGLLVHNKPMIDCTGADACGGLSEDSGYCTAGWCHRCCGGTLENSSRPSCEAGVTAGVCSGGWPPC